MECILRSKYGRAYLFSGLKQQTFCICRLSKTTFTSFSTSTKLPSESTTTALTTSGSKCIMTQSLATGTISPLFFANARNVPLIREGPSTMFATRISSFLLFNIMIMLFHTKFCSILSSSVSMTSRFMTMTNDQI